MAVHYCFTCGDCGAVQSACYVQRSVMGAPALVCDERIVVRTYMFCVYMGDRPLSLRYT